MTPIQFFGFAFAAFCGLMLALLFFSDPPSCFRRKKPAKFRPVILFDIETTPF